MCGKETSTRLLIVDLDSYRLVLDVAISFNHVHALVEVATVVHGSCNLDEKGTEDLGAALKNRTGL